jgi:hypothetical protein
MRRSPPPLSSSRRVGLPRPPPPLTLDGADGNGAVAAGVGEPTEADGVLGEDSFDPFSLRIGASDD